jgi:uncharacterized DUF497 family protein
MFVWDENKNRLNKEKHGFYLSDIVDVFEDPHLIDWYDAAHSSLDEDRYICLGSFQNMVILFVVFTEKDDDIHLITARKAEPHEEALYYEHYRKSTDSGRN